MSSLYKKVLATIVILLLTLIIGLYAGVRNTTDYHISEMEFDEIKADVKVYRDDYGVPTIIAENEDDLFFAQGYEYARDRLWQAEFFRAVASGELAELFGSGDDDSLIKADKYLRTLALRKTADEVVKRIDDSLKNILTQYVKGLNKYIEIHKNNLPLEFVLIGSEPKKWKIEDVIAIQGAMSETLSIYGMSNEILRMELLEHFGAENALEILPISYQPAEDYYKSVNVSDFTTTSNVDLSFRNIFRTVDVQGAFGSNNWVVGPNNTTTGNPIIANDPHLSLSTPGIWWQVHLYSPTFHVEGFSLPGTPGVVIGHNDNVAWGVTNTGTDAVDLFYFNTNQEGQYLFNGSYRDYEIQTEDIKVKDGSTVEYEIKYTEHGPILDPDIFPINDKFPYALKWTLHQNYSRDNIFKAIVDLNRANNASDIINALEYWGNPGQNVVFATTEGDFGYQYTGITPIRKVEGSGVIPQNGSNPNYGWNGTIAYDDQYRVLNPAKGFFGTANQKVDIRDSTDPSNAFYISAYYDLDFRGERINNYLSSHGKISIEEMRELQGDTYNLYAETILPVYISAIENGDYSGDLEDLSNDAIDELKNWEYEMHREEIGASIFGTWRIYFEELTFKDEMDQYDDELYEKYHYNAPEGLLEIIGDVDSPWFDDKTTTEVENAYDIAVWAFKKTVEFLDENAGGRISQWKYRRIHEVEFEHPMGSALWLFDEGNKPSDGSRFTVKASSGDPAWTEEGPDFKQGAGPSMRFIAEVEPSWSNTEGIVVPGESGHLFSSNRGNSVNDWINNINHPWNFDIEREGSPDFTFRKK